MASFKLGARYDSQTLDSIAHLLAITAMCFVLDVMAHLLKIPCCRSGVDCARFFEITVAICNSASRRKCQTVVILFEGLAERGGIRTPVRVFIP